MSGGTLSLRAADDLSALSVRAEGRPGGRDVLSGVLREADAGEVVDDHVWLDISWLRGAAGDRESGWRRGFDAMLDYAGSRGWLSPDGRRVRAHVEWLPRGGVSARVED